MAGPSTAIFPLSVNYIVPVKASGVVATSQSQGGRGKFVFENYLN